MYNRTKYGSLLCVALLLLGSCTQNSAQQAAVKKTYCISNDKLKRQSAAAKDFCRRNRFDTLHCILVDMSVHSGNNRFVVWDFKKDTTMLNALVSHGCGAGPWGKDRSKNKPVFSNLDNSHCSSLGKYKIGARGQSQWGIGVNYLLQGLDSSNSNALKREIVLHSWEDIPDEELYPDGTPEGWGCPALSNNTMKQVDALLQGKKRPVLLWIYR